MSLLLIHYPLTATERDKSDSQANPPFFQLLLSNSASHLYISTSWLTFQDIRFLQRCLLQKEHVLNLIVHERGGGSPTLCEVHDVVERRTGWKTHHIFTITNTLATVQLSTEVSSNRWRIPIGNRDWGESGVCRRFTSKTLTVSEHIFHHLSSYEHLQDSWQSVRFLQRTVGLRAKTTHRQQKPYCLGLNEAKTNALGARSRKLSAEFRIIMSFNFVQDFISPHESENDFSDLFGPPIQLRWSPLPDLSNLIRLHQMSLLWKLWLRKHHKQLVIFNGLVLLILPGVSSITQWSNYIIIGFLDVKNKESSRH